MEEELGHFSKERQERQNKLQMKHLKETEEFDVQSATLGMDVKQIIDATSNLYDIDDDTDSVRGSVVSLTPSTSTNSFTHTQTQL